MAAAPKGPQLMLEGFMIRPLVHVVDFHSKEISPLGIMETRVKLSEIAHFVAEQWPSMFASLEQQMADQMAAEAAKAAKAEEAAQAEIDDPNNSVVAPITRKPVAKRGAKKTPAAVRRPV